MEESLSSLTEKQVVNLCDGKILGCIIDFCIDICEGCLTAIIIPGESGIFGFKKGTEIVIPWEKIKKIGKDTIIVDIGVLPKDCDVCGEKKKRKKEC